MFPVTLSTERNHEIYCIGDVFIEMLYCVIEKYIETKRVESESTQVSQRRFKLG